MSTAAGGSARDSIRLLTGAEESPAPSTPSDDCDEPVSSEDPVGSEEPAASEEPVASEQPASEAPVASEEPCDDGDGEEPNDPADEEENGEDGDGNGGSTTNHGSAVRVAAHCDVHGRAHGELVRSVAQDKDATVASAEQACADALSAAEQDDAKGKGNPKRQEAPRPKSRTRKQRTWRWAGFIQESTRSSRPECCEAGKSEGEQRRRVDKLCARELCEQREVDEQVARFV